MHRSSSRVAVGAAAILSALTLTAFTAAPASAADGITNGDFETGALTPWTTAGTTSAVSTGAHGGTYAAQDGSTAPTSGDSSITQTFTAPTGAAQLSFYYSVTCPDTLTYDWATATLKDNTSATTATPLPKTCTNGAGWKQATAAVTAGHSYTLTLTSHDDNYAGDATLVKYDDVTITAGSPPPPPPPGLTQVSTDPYTNATSQHATELEPDTLSNGSTIVASSQVGRFNDGGASNIGWNTSADGGTTWQHGMLPGITTAQGGTWARVSDPSVAWDAKHGTWMITGLVINAQVGGAGVSVSRSANGTSWLNPVMAIGTAGLDYDKEWIACDNTTTSPFYGNCYIEVDITTNGNQIVMSTSADGGATWSAAKTPAGSPSGLGGQPLVQPSGTVVVPYSGNGASIGAFTSTTGGSTWTSGVQVASVSSHSIAGSMRSGDGLPSAEIDGAGKVYVAWQDCRFRSGCPANDIVYSTSSNGTTWSAVTRVPTDATTSGIDHFIPGIGVDRGTSGATAHLGLYYYFFPNANCSAATCQLQVGYTSSVNGGSTWSAPSTVAGPMSVSQIANTTQGRMVGDYISCSITAGKAVSVFAVGKTPTNGKAFDEALYTAGPLAVTGGARRSITAPVFTTHPASGPHRTAR
ncbi:MAG: hypothetical protein QOI35_2935 [Cryptosporangiaceae bacterium]|nr:hypothetical protein [Cryptosporangiaceae bacterium]